MPSTTGTDIYVKFEGVDGECTDADHKKWSEVTSMTHNIEQPASSSAAGGALSTGRARHDDFLLTKLIDSSSPKLHQICCSGKELDKVTIEIMRSAGDKKVKQLAVQMDKVVISRIALSGTSENSERPGEIVGCRYKKIQWTYNTGSGNTSAAYSLEEHKAS